jgi:hypothetical protein
MIYCTVYVGAKIDFKCSVKEYKYGDRGCYFWLTQDPGLATQAPRLPFNGEVANTIKSLPYVKDVVPGYTRIYSTGSAQC